MSAAVTKVEISGTLRVVLHFTDEQPFLVPTKIVIMNFIILSLFNRNESYCDCQGAVQISFIDHPNLDYDLQVKIESTVVDNDDKVFNVQVAKGGGGVPPPHICQTAKNKGGGVPPMPNSTYAKQQTGCTSLMGPAT